MVAVLATLSATVGGSAKTTVGAIAGPALIAVGTIATVRDAASRRGASTPIGTCQRLPTITERPATLDERPARAAAEARCTVIVVMAVLSASAGAVPGGAEPTVGAVSREALFIALASFAKPKLRRRRYRLQHGHQRAGHQSQEKGSDIEWKRVWTCVPCHACSDLPNLPGQARRKVQTESTRATSSGLQVSVPLRAKAGFKDTAASRTLSATACAAAAMVAVMAVFTSPPGTVAWSAECPVSTVAAPAICVHFTDPAVGIALRPRHGRGYRLSGRLGHARDDRLCHCPTCRLRNAWDDGLRNGPARRLRHARNHRLCNGVGHDTSTLLDGLRHLGRQGTGDKHADQQNADNKQRGSKSRVSNRHDVRRHGRSLSLKACERCRNSIPVPYCRPEETGLPLSVVSTSARIVRCLT